MRVNVTYSVELDEIKQIVQELLLKVEDDVEAVGKYFVEAQKSVNRDNEREAVELIDNCRKSMAILDHSLFDCRNILNGYQQAVLVKNDQTKIESDVDENYDTKGG
jgi:hypothetical protein